MVSCNLTEKTTEDELSSAAVKLSKPYHNGDNIKIIIKDIPVLGTATSPNVHGRDVLHMIPNVE